jgi:hypothetical protein
MAVTVAAAEERDGITVRVRGPQPVTYVTVMATGPDGQPPRVLQLLLRKAGQDRDTSSSSRPNPDGSRTLTDVAAGEYRITARSGALYGTADVLVDGEHPNTVAISLTPGVRVTGTTSVPGGALPPDSRVVFIMLSSVDAEGTYDPGFARVNPDGSFAITGVPPGRYLLRTSLDGPNGWVLASARAGGLDAADVPITIGRDNVSDLVVTFTNERTLLKGVVTDDGGPANGVDVVAFPLDPSYRVRGTRRVARSRTTIAGEYELRGLPPGTYGLAVMEDVDDNVLRDPAVLRKLQPLATVTLAAGETRTANITVGR